MTTPHAWRLILWGRFKCRLLGRHRNTVRTSHDYRVTFCARYWGYSVVREVCG